LTSTNASGARDLGVLAGNRGPFSDGGKESRLQCFAEELDHARFPKNGWQFGLQNRVPKNVRLFGGPQSVTERSIDCNPEKRLRFRGGTGSARSRQSPELVTKTNS